MKPNNHDYIGMNEMQIKKCLRQSCVCNGSNKSENEFINPLLTQDSRHPHNKMFSTYCDTAKKTDKNS